MSKRKPSPHLLMAGILLALSVGLGGRVPARAFSPESQGQDAKPAAAIIQRAIDTEGLAAARTRMDDMRAHADQYVFSERDINALGYAYLSRRAFAEALAVFEFNVRSFPSSDNVYDSLAEASVRAGDGPRTEAVLEAWLARSPGNAATARRVAEFRTMAGRHKNEVRNAYRPGRPTGIKGPYFGQKPPGNTPSLFAPGVVSLAFEADYAPTLSPDGREFYFTRAGTPQVIMVSRLGPDGWTYPEPLAASAGSSAHEPRVSFDNKRIYWGWMRPVPPGEPNVQKMDYGIWASERTDAGWSAPTFVGQGMFISFTKDGQAYVTDHTELPNGYLARVRMVNGKFAGFDRLQGGMEKLRSEKLRNIAHPGIAPDGSFILFDIGGSHLFVCFREADGTWGDVVDLTEHGVDPMAGIASVSPDGQYVFFGLRGDIYWVGASFIEGLRPRR